MPRETKSKANARAGARRPAGAKAKRAAEKTPASRAKEARPVVRLGEVAPNGICASMYGLLERGVDRRARVARSTRGTVLFRFDEDFAPIRVTFTPDEVRVEDVPDGQRKGSRPDLVVSGSLPGIVQLASAPLVGGVPKPTSARGRAALAKLASGSVRIEGSPLLARKVLKLLEI